MSGHTPGSSPLPATIGRVFITGFMGAGKTTVGRLVAERLGWDFVDSDHLLEAQTGQSIAAIFATQGEPAFRDLEAAAIRACAERDRIVLALGGGALERGETLDLLASLPESVLIYLDAPLDLLVSRCSAQPNAAVRPVLADRDRLEARWQARQSGYRRAHLTVNTERCSPGEVAGRILEKIGARCRGVDSPGASLRTGVPA